MAWALKERRKKTLNKYNEKVFEFERFVPSIPKTPEKKLLMTDL